MNYKEEYWSSHDHKPWDEWLQERYNDGWRLVCYYVDHNPDGTTGGRLVTFRRTRGHQ